MCHPERSEESECISGCTQILHFVQDDTPKQKNMNTIYYAIQNIIRGKDSTIIKVVSLSLGLFLSIVLFALVGTQLSYDSVYQDNEDIYVVETEWSDNEDKPVSRSVSQFIFSSINPPNNITYSNIYL